MTSNNLPQIKVNLSTVIAPHFYPVHKAIKSGEKSEFWLKGGRGSTKSSFVALQIILGIMRDPNANGIGFRKVGDTIKDSLLSTLLWATDVLQVSENFSHTVSPPTIVYKPTGQKILLKGLDKALKLKSLKIKKGYFKFVWFEEATEFDGMDEIRNVEQSVMRGGEKFVEFISYNPPKDPDAWVNEEAEKVYHDRLVSSSTYLQVPREWLGEKFFEKAERLKENDPLAYNHEYLGISTGNSEQTVMNGKWREGFVNLTPDWDGPYDGGDWGFSTDPTARVRCWVNTALRTLYIEQEAVGYHVELNEIVEFEGKPGLFDQIPNAKNVLCIADCSRPETISHVKNAGYAIEPCVKWQGSVEDGIAFLRSFDIIIVNPNCVHTLSEMRLYSYKVDRLTKKITADIIDKYNHCIDAIRYALGPLIKRKGAGFFDNL